MKAINVPFQIALWAVTMLFFSSCSATNNPGINLVGSTPGDPAIKSMLAIPANENADFIRWNLKLMDDNSFNLDISYGESQPNTLGFKEGSKKKTIVGRFTIAKNQLKGFKEVYELISNDFVETISLAKLNENIYHILTLDKQLMIGNGGWSYSLNRLEAVEADSILIVSPTAVDKDSEVVFEGRTPCQEFKEAHPEMQASSGCFKIKWKLVLYKDAVANKPTTCTVRNIVDNQPRDISGTWEIIKGTATSPNATIYSIRVDNLQEPLLFLQADDNVLFFLDRNMNPFVGNQDFSFALNRKK